MHSSACESGAQSILPTAGCGASALTVLCAMVTNADVPMTRPDRARDQVGAAEERRGETGRRTLPEVFRGVDVHQPGVVHHHDPVGQRQRLGLVVGDVEHRGVGQRLLEALQLGEHGLTQLRVQRGERFVEQQHLGLDRQRAGDRDPLLLSTGKLTGQAAFHTTPCPTMSSASVTRDPISPRGTRCDFSPNATFSDTRMCGNSA